MRDLGGLVSLGCVFSWLEASQRWPSSLPGASTSNGRGVGSSAAVRSYPLSVEMISAG